MIGRLRSGSRTRVVLAEARSHSQNSICVVLSHQRNDFVRSIISALRKVVHKVPGREWVTKKLVGDTGSCEQLSGCCLRVHAAFFLFVGLVGLGCSRFVVAGKGW